MVAETPSEMGHIDWTVFAISISCLALLFGLSAIKSKWIKIVPPQLIVVIVGALIGQFCHLDHKFLVHAPANPFEHGIVLPDFPALFADHTIWGAIFSCLLLLAFVDGTESLATIHAVDRLDPFHRKSSPDRTLFAMGVSNICSSLIGGLTIIPGIIKSTTCIVSGARTAWINFYNAIFLILFLVLGSGLIDLIPLGALSAVLVHIGYKLAGPHKWRYISSVGKEQLCIFISTILVTLKVDLLLGIFTGMFVKLLIVMIYAARVAKSNGQKKLTVRAAIHAIFKNPVAESKLEGDTFNVKLNGPLTCFNSLWLRKVLDHVPSEAKLVRIDLGENVTLIDHSINLYLHTQKSDLARAGVAMEISGIEQMHGNSDEPTALRFKVSSDESLVPQA
jgi:MFS superfamily sulfate permease-like transporter